MPALFLVLACALWGLSFPVVKALQMEQGGRLPGAGSEFLSAWIQFARFGLGTLLLLPFALRGGPPTRLEWRQGFLIALYGGAGMALQADGLAYTEASTSAFLTQAYCIVLPIIVCLRLRQAPGARTLIATLMVIIGGAVLSGFTPANPRIGRGELQTLIAAVFFAFQILTLENPLYRANRSTRVTLVMCVAITLIFLPIAVVTAPFPAAVIVAGASWSVFALVMILAACCSVAAFLLMNHWQRRVSAVEAGMIYTTEPVFAAVYALFLPLWISRIAGMDYPNESLSLQLLIGGLLILAANILMQLKRPPHRPAMAPAP
jgi:drug/metabolite transporter (DMT)-like permease